MKILLNFIFISSLIHLIHAVILKTPMSNNYPQIAVLGCDTNKANLYYDTDRRVWVEHLVSSCVNTEQSILDFCKKAYPTLRVGNILRLDTILRFKNWCELKSSSNGNDAPECKTENQSEELVQPYRCLYINYKREKLTLPASDCVMNSITGTGQCLRAEKWQQLAALNCSNKTMVLNSSLMTTDWCGLSKFRGMEFTCCPLKDADKKTDDDYDDALNEDDPIGELDAQPIVNKFENHRKIIAMTLGSRAPTWVADSNQWDKMPGYFSDDEDVNDDQEEIKLSSSRKSHLTMNEHERFTKDKEDFRRKYQAQIDQLKNRWQQREKEIQATANINPFQAQQDYTISDATFRGEYEALKQSANRERTRVNELHENNLDTILSIAKNQTNQKLINAWNEIPIKTQAIEDALYDYLHVLLRDRIHLVNRYERLRAVDPNQAKRKRVSIHERLRSIADDINDALKQLQRHLDLQAQIQPRINKLLDEYAEVNQAADKLLIDYFSSSTTVKPRLLPLGRDEKKIYPASLNKGNDKEANDDYYATNDDDYDDDDDDDDDDSTTTTTTTTVTVTTAIDINNDDFNDQLNINDKESYAEDNIDTESNGITDVNDYDEPISVDMPPLIPNNQANRRNQQNVLTVYLPYIFGCLLILCIICGVFVIRFLMVQRRKFQYGNNYEKTYVFKEVDCLTPEEKALHALQMNGYENPTYKFFESQPQKC